MKRIYFACSIAGGRDHAHVYVDIVDYINASGAKVMSELFVDPSLKPELGTNPGLSPSAIWKRDIDWVTSADAIIAEVTQPSLGVGYEIGKAEEMNKPILALFCTEAGRRLSPMIDGNPNITIIRYKKIEETNKAIAEFIKNI